jgi:YegS/Rv2252/BmrU family lipid kinase
MKLFHLIANPVAGKKKAEKNIELVKSVLKASGADVDVYHSTCVGDAKRIARELTESGARELIALGGDGTLHEVLNGIVSVQDCHLGLIPSGTGNDFAEHVGLPLDVEKAVEVILKGETVPTDYLEVGGVRCMNVAGMGMDVDVLDRCRKGKMRGKVKYLLCLIQSLFAFKGIKVQIEHGDETEERDVLIAAACNGSQFGGGIKICPTADSKDGKLNAVIVDCIGGKLKIIQAFLELMKGRILEYPLAKHVLCDRLKFTPAMPCTVQLDGELYKDLSFDVTIGKGLKFYR